MAKRPRECPRECPRHVVRRVSGRTLSGAVRPNRPVRDGRTDAEGRRDRTGQDVRSVRPSVLEIVLGIVLEKSGHLLARPTAATETPPMLDLAMPVTDTSRSLDHLRRRACARE